MEKDRVYKASWRLYSPKTSGGKFNAIIFPNKSIINADPIWPKITIILSAPIFFFTISINIL